MMKSGIMRRRYKKSPAVKRGCLGRLARVKQTGEMPQTILLAEKGIQLVYFPVQGTSAGIVLLMVQPEYTEA